MYSIIIEKCLGPLLLQVLERVVYLYVNHNESHHTRIPWYVRGKQRPKHKYEYITNT